MRLIDLEPKWIDHYSDETHGFIRERDACTDVHYSPGEESPGETTLSHAQGVLFLCPKCFKENEGPVGTHSVLVWFSGRGVPEYVEPKARWGASGSSLADLTTTPSILIRGGCGWHGFITAGEVSIL